MSIIFETLPLVQPNIITGYALVEDPLLSIFKPVSAPECHITISDYQQLGV
jgi:hypothetical protein